MAVVELLKLRCGVGGIMTVVVLLLLVVVRCWRCFVVGDVSLLSFCRWRYWCWFPQIKSHFIQYCCTSSDGNGNCGSNGSVAGQSKLGTNATCILFSTPTNIHEISSSR